MLLKAIQIAEVKEIVCNAISSATTIKNNLNATVVPTVNDDSSKGYSVGSDWIYNSITYTCTDTTVGNAIWVSNADITYFDDWLSAVSSLSNAGSTYVNKYISITNANGAPPSGTIYTAPATVTNPIVDGGSAIYKVNAQGSNFSVTCQKRTVTNPVVTSVMLTATAKPTTAGYYIFTVVPTNGLPTGVALNDIAYFDGVTWSVWQKYAAANTVLVCGSTPNTQITWRKFQGTWMSTADEYIPDGQEYQTGKLYNGKPVYRKCVNGTMVSTQNINANAGFTVPMTGKIIYIAGICNRTDNAIITITGNGEAQILVTNTGTVVTWTSSTLYLSRPFTAWVEYTKS